MSRFDTARRVRILAWTGAALAWGTAVTLAGLEPSSAEVASPPAPNPFDSAVLPASQVAVMPNMPPSGLVILRYQPSEESSPEVRTVYVQQKAPRASRVAPPQQTSAPTPKSSGS